MQNPIATTVANDGASVPEKPEHLTYSEMYRHLMNCGEDHREFTFFPSKNAIQQVEFLWGHLQGILAINRNLRADLSQDDYRTLWGAKEYLTLKVQVMVKEEEWLMQYLIGYSASYVGAMEDK